MSGVQSKTLNVLLDRDTITIPIDVHSQCAENTRHGVRFLDSLLQLAIGPFIFPSHLPILAHEAATST